MKAPLKRPATPKTMRTGDCATAIAQTDEAASLARAATALFLAFVFSFVSVFVAQTHTTRRNLHASSPSSRLPINGTLTHLQTLRGRVPIATAACNMQRSLGSARSNDDDERQVDDSPPNRCVPR